VKRILLREKELAGRDDRLRQRFTKFLRGNAGTQVPYIGAKRISLGGGATVIAIHQGQTQSDYTMWRVRHNRAGLAISYHEVWSYTQIGSGGGTLHRPCLVLKKAYLHLYRSEGDEAADGGKLFFFHCDPLDEHKYQAGPHLHAECAGYPWNKKHIPLCDGFSEIVLEDIGHLDAAFDRIVDMIGAEFLPPH
jgi:hypothetical protein